MMDLVSGPRRIGGRDPLYTYFDMMFRPQAYEGADVVYVKNKAVRYAIAEKLESSQEVVDRVPALEERMKAFRASGLISPQTPRRPGARAVARAHEGGPDPNRPPGRGDGERDPNDAAGGPGFHAQGDFRPRNSSAESLWRSMTKVMLVPGQDPEAPQLQPQVTIEGLDDAQQARIAGAWFELGDSWVNGDSAGVNGASARLAAELAEVNPDLYPERARLGWESWYFQNDQLTRIWLVYMLSVILLLLGLVYQWRWARWSGLAVFLVAFALQTASVGLRWYISGRWPNANMFEAVTTAAWFGSLCAIILELLARRTGMRSIFALAAATASMVALMAANFLPAYLNPNIDNKMPVLHDIWLYIHTNVIIFSYCLIFMASVSAVLYLINRFLGGAPTFARVGGAGSLVARYGCGRGGPQQGRRAPGTPRASWGDPRRRDDAPDGTRLRPALDGTRDGRDLGGSLLGQAVGLGSQGGLCTQTRSSSSRSWSTYASNRATRAYGPRGWRWSVLV